MNLRDLWRRLKQIVFHNILHLDDTPHRIAWGVFLGAMIAFTPTLGLPCICCPLSFRQIVIGVNTCKSSSANIILKHFGVSSIDSTKPSEFSLATIPIAVMVEVFCRQLAVGNLVDCLYLGNHLHWKW